jgi:hypothetical protein
MLDNGALERVCRTFENLGLTVSVADFRNAAMREWEVHSKCKCHECGREWEAQLRSIKDDDVTELVSNAIYLMLSPSISAALVAHRRDCFKTKAP